MSLVIIRARSLTKRLTLAVLTKKEVYKNVASFENMTVWAMKLFLSNKVVNLFLFKNVSL